MTRRALLAALLLAGCQQAPPAANNMADANAAPPAAASAPASDLDGPLARYVGKYPEDKVGARSFLDEPLVRDGVARVVDDPAVAKLVLAPATAVPIVARDGQLIAGACEPHNCGEHNWAIRIRPDGARPLVCHKPEGAAPRWYGPTPVGAAKDGCLPSS